MSIIFSVIIPAHRRPEALEKCLAALAPGIQTILPENYEVIVSDDSPVAESLESLILERFSWARWVEGPRRGPAANRNQGARCAKGKWLVFTDDDCFPDGGWLEAFSRGIAENQSVQVFEGRVYADGPRRSLAEAAPLNETGGFLWSCNFAIRKALFDALHGFNEAFQHAAMEDVELMYRLRRRGEDVVFVSSAAVCHPWRRRGGWTEILRHQKATFLYLQLHPEERRRINGSVYLKSVLRGFAREIFPALISFRAAGLCEAIVEQIGSLFMACRLAFGPGVDGSGRIERHGQSDSA